MDEAIEIAEMIDNFEFDESVKLTNSCKMDELLTREVNAALEHYQNKEYENRCS